MPTDSQSGVKRFLNYLILILILIFITVFLYSTEQIGQEAEQVHIEKTINEMNAAMALTLYEFVVNNQVQELERFDRGNPFVFLATQKMLPANYRGEVNSLAYATSKGAWYYLRDSLCVSCEHALYCCRAIFGAVFGRVVNQLMLSL